jgi:Tol biopolymer transport system component
VSSTDAGVGYLVFIQGETLMAQPFDNRRLEFTAPALPVAEQLGDGRGFSASANGLIYEPNHGNSRQLTWYDRDGKNMGAVGELGKYDSLAFSPDPTRAAVSRGSAGEALSIWFLDLLAGTSERFLSGSASHGYAVWSPDASRVVFASDPNGAFDLYYQPVNRTKDAELLLKSAADKFPTSWSHDGRLLLFTQYDAKTRRDLWVLPLDGEKRPLPLLVTPLNETNARFSPDGLWIAYESDASGIYEVYVRSFTMNASRSAVEVGGEWQVSKGCGTQPIWRSDGRELFYYSCDKRIMAVDITTGSEFRAGKPQRLGIPQFEGAWGTPDGKRFLVQAPDDKPQPYTVVLNWQAGLKK